MLIKNITTDLFILKINCLTEEIFIEIAQSEDINDDEIYLVKKEES